MVLVHSVCFVYFAGQSKDCRQVSSAFTMRDVEWDTWTCVLGFPVRGEEDTKHAIVLSQGCELGACCASACRKKAGIG